MMRSQNWTKHLVCIGTKTKIQSTWEVRQRMTLIISPTCHEHSMCPSLCNTVISAAFTPMNSKLGFLKLWVVSGGSTHKKTARSHVLHNDNLL